MVNCPKCGFSQPQDQYCASCGVNMDAFRARTRASKSLIQNPFVQVGSFAVILIATFVFVRSTNKSKPDRMAIDTPIIRESAQQESELAQAQADQTSARQAMNVANRRCRTGKRKPSRCGRRTSTHRPSNIPLCECTRSRSNRHAARKNPIRISGNSRGSPASPKRENLFHRSTAVFLKRTDVRCTRFGQ